MTGLPDPDRFVALLEEHKRILYKVANAYCRNREDRADLIQDAITQLWRSFGQFDDRHRFSTWMYRIALNVAISFHHSVSGWTQPRRDRRNHGHLNDQRRDDLVLVIALGAFIANHVTNAAFVAPAIVLDAFAIGLVVACARQLAMLSAIDFSGPIVCAQKSLETLRRLRIRKTMWTLMLAPALWTPLVVVGLKGAFGVNAYSALGGAWLAANALFGLAVIPVMIWVSRRYADRMAQSPFVQGLMNDIAGRSLTAAAAFLDQLAIFEREDAHAV